MARAITSAFTLDPCPWQHDDVLRRVVHALTGAGGMTRLVGGAVRNAVMGRVVQKTDYDLASTLIPEQVMARAEQAGFKVVPTGLDHGTVTVVCDGRGFEVTTLRSDVTTDGRRATVSFTEDWAADAARRDFTLNALYADLDGTVYDPLGGGVDDARAGRVRFVGSASTRIAEDYLRILRFFRFHAAYGAGGMDREGLVACAAAAAKIHTLSRERVTMEMLKWLGTDDPTPTIQTAQDHGILRHIIPAEFRGDMMARLVDLQRDVNAPEVLARLHLLMDGYDPAPILRLSRTQARYMQSLDQTVLEPDGTEISLKRDIYRYGYDLVVQRAVLDIAERAGAVPYEPQILQALKHLKTWPVPKFSVTGADLIAAGDVPGPVLGAKLRAIEQDWIARDFQTTIVVQSKRLTVERVPSPLQGEGGVGERTNRDK